MDGMRWALWAVVLTWQLHGSLQQQCDNSNVLSFGATGNGNSDDSGAFSKMEGDASVGIIFMPRGTYRIAQQGTLVLTKSIIAEEGAVFQIDGGSTLKLYGQPEHPYSLFFQGQGIVTFADGTQYVAPEWFGAAGDGSKDDSEAIRKAYAAAQQTSNAFLYLRGKYALGSEVRFVLGPANGVVLVSEAAAEFTSWNGNPQGLTIVGDQPFVSYLPNFSGFSDFCIQLEGASLTSLRLKSLTNCGDAIRFRSTNSQQNCLDNSIWFDAITNSRVGIAVRAEGFFVFQGNHVVGNSIIGGGTGDNTFAIVFFSSKGDVKPGWDSNTFDIAKVTPPNNPNYKVFDTFPGNDKLIIKIGSLDALANPSSKIFGNGVLGMSFMSINLAAPLQENQINLKGPMNLLELTGATTPASPNEAVRCTTQPNSKASFNGGRALVGNFHTLLAVSDGDWPNGAVREVYAYHQLANDELYQIKCDGPKNAQGLPSIGCLAFIDQHGASPGQIKFWVVNNSGGMVKGGDGAPFTIAVSTLGTFS